VHTHFIRYTATILIVVLLQACGGGSVSGNSAATVSGISSPTAILSGVAATGAAIDGTVTLKDSTGATRSAVISLPSGTFSMDVSGLTPPYFLKATNNTGTLTLYSIATGSGTFNINPLSNLVAVAAAMSIDPLAKTPDAAFNNPAHFNTLTVAQIQTAIDSVMAQMSPAFKSALAANGVTNVNPLTDSYQIGNGLDKVFDSFVVTLDTVTGIGQGHQVCGQTSAGAGSTTTPPAGTLIITAMPVCKTYDGQVYSGGNGVTYNGFLNGDTPAVLGGTLTYGGTWQSTKNVGTYTIIPSGLTSSSYNIVFVNSTLTTSPATLTLTVISNTSNIYNANAVTVASGETLTLTGNETIGSLAGAGNVDLGAFTLTVGGDNTNTTFSGVISGTGGLTKVGTGTLTLTAASIYIGTISVLDGGLIVNGTLSVNGTAVSSTPASSGAAGTISLSGFAAGDTLTSSTGVMTGGLVLAGTYNIAPSITLIGNTTSISGGTISVVANYGLTTTGATTATISAATLSAGP
jgi:autotransporter-associated beta strand protein